MSHMSWSTSCPFDCDSSWSDTPVVTKENSVKPNQSAGARMHKVRRALAAKSPEHGAGGSLRLSWRGGERAQGEREEQAVDLRVASGRHARGEDPAAIVSSASVCDKKTSCGAAK